MADLATVADLQARLGRALDVTETIRAEALLAGASARVRSYTGQTFDTATTTDRMPVRKGQVHLPQRPATAVTTVEDVEGNSLDFIWYAGQQLTIGQVNRFDYEPFRYGTNWVDVTYTHGYSTTPADVVEVVCQMVLRAFGADPESSSLTQESVEGYSYQMGAAGAAGAVGMLDDERSALDVYRRKGGTIRLAT